MSLEADRFEAGVRTLAISEEIIDLVEEAMSLVRGVGTPTEIARARGYWLAIIRILLNEDHGFMGRGGCTMEDTARELMVEEEECSHSWHEEGGGDRCPRCGSDGTDEE